MSKLTVGELKQVIENIPDDYIVTIASDTGVEQCDDNDFDIVVEDAYERNKELVIYANYKDFIEEEEED
ncbi:MAG: hypothetical protein J6K45_06385 [Clostridia bacterium]|nr:hypothetical protein [Clostridia bacterium]